MILIHKPWLTRTNNIYNSVVDGGSCRSKNPDIWHRHVRVWCHGAAILHKIGHGGKPKTRHRYPPWRCHGQYLTTLNINGGKQDNESYLKSFIVALVFPSQIGGAWLDWYHKCKHYRSEIIHHVWNRFKSDLQN